MGRRRGAAEVAVVRVSSEVSIAADEAPEGRGLITQSVYSGR